MQEQVYSEIDSTPHNVYIDVESNHLAVITDMGWAKSPCWEISLPYPATEEERMSYVISLIKSLKFAPDENRSDLQDLANYADAELAHLIEHGGVLDRGHGHYALDILTEEGNLLATIKFDIACGRKVGKNVEDIPFLGMSDGCGYNAAANTWLQVKPDVAKLYGLTDGTEVFERVGEDALSGEPLAVFDTYVGDHRVRRAFKFNQCEYEAGLGGKFITRVEFAVCPAGLDVPHFIVHDLEDRILTITCLDLDYYRSQPHKMQEDTLTVLNQSKLNLSVNENTIYAIENDTEELENA